ncbi:MAG: ABC transporter ATP-binding protein [Pseudomonadota bacterium]
MKIPEAEDQVAQTSAILSVRNLTKKFGEFYANKSISFDLHAGEVHALLGENGAGKSTLVKMLYGSLQPTSGVILKDGSPISITSPFHARKQGIGMVFQHFSLFEALSVAENIALSMPAGQSIREVSQNAGVLGERYGLPLNPNALIGDLSVGERQRVEIIRCLLQDPKIIILDEPTSVLTPQEAENLFKTLETFRNEGRSILFISHRLEEVKQHCDTATILRFGEIVTTCDPKKETAASIAKLMVGADVSAVSKASKDRNKNKDVLKLNNLNLESTSPFSVPLKHLNLSVKQGEVLGIAGVAGNGQTELFEVISGEKLAKENDKVEILGKPVGTKSITDRRLSGAAFVPEERVGHGAISSFRLSQNMLLARHASDRVAFQWGKSLGLIWSEMVEKATKRVVATMDVRKSGEDPIAASLSGGNLQKFIVGRELDRQPTLLVVNQPSWGVDAGAASGIRQAIIDLANSGSGVLVISQDLDEIFEISDRVAVMFDGTLSDAVNTKEISREEIGLLMAGVKPQHHKTDGEHAA